MPGRRIEAPRAAVHRNIPLLARGNGIGPLGAPLCVLYLPKMGIRRQTRGRGGTSIAPGAVSSPQSRRPPRSRLEPKLEQLPEARPRPRIQDRVRAQAL